MYVLRNFAVEEMFSSESLNARKEKNMSTDELPTREDEIRSQVFLSYESLKSRKRRIFLPTSYIQGQVRESQGSRCVRQAGLVYRHKKGTWESQEKEKKRKRPRKARRGLQRRQGSVCPTPRILFFGSRVFGLRSGPSRLKHRLLRDLVYEEAMCEGSSGNGLLYVAKAVP